METSTTAWLQTFAFQARANRVVNRRLLAVLAQHPHAWERPMPGYFRDIDAILSHVYVADGFWTADIAFSAGLPLREELDIEHLPQYETFRFESFAQAQALRAAGDTVLERLVSQLSEDSLLLPVMDFQDPSVGVNQPVWKSLLHLFNHQAHHRGQISQALEQFGIPHNYSNLIDIE